MTSISTLNTKLTPPYTNFLLTWDGNPGLYMRALFCSKDKSKFQMNVKMNSDRLPLWQIVLYSYKWAFQTNLKPSELQGFIDTSFTIWMIFDSEYSYSTLIPLFNTIKKLYEKFNTNHQYVWARSHKLSRAQLWRSRVQSKVSRSNI